MAAKRSFQYTAVVRQSPFEILSSLKCTLLFFPRLSETVKMVM